MKKWTLLAVLLACPAQSWAFDLGDLAGGLAGIAAYRYENRQREKFVKAQGQEAQRLYQTAPSQGTWRVSYTVSRPQGIVGQLFTPTPYGGLSRDTVSVQVWSSNGQRGYSLRQSSFGGPGGYSSSSVFYQEPPPFRERPQQKSSANAGGAAGPTARLLRSVGINP